MTRRRAARGVPSGPALAVLIAALTTALVAPGSASAAQAPTASLDDPTVDADLARAVEASSTVAHTGTVTVASFSDRGPEVTQVEMTRGVGSLRYTRDGGWEIGRADGTGFLASSSTLLRVGGVERVPDQLDRLRTKYELRRGPSGPLDTGPARAIDVVEQATGTLRERVHLDERTGLIVRRETYDREGEPLRVVAYTELVVEDRAVVAPTADGRDVRDHAMLLTSRRDLVRAGFEVPARLPAGYELLEAGELEDASVPTSHLLYGDGLYTVSVFQQRGRLAPRAVRDATELRRADGGAVWRWPGSEPRRMVWSGDGHVYTALTDAPSDELLEVVGGLPSDPAPSILDRLTRGLIRVGRWFVPTDRSVP